MPPKKKKIEEETKEGEIQSDMPVTQPKTKPKSAKAQGTKKPSGRGTRRGGDSSESEEDDIDFADFVSSGSENEVSTKPSSRAAKKKTTNKVLKTEEAQDVKEAQIAATSMRQSAIGSRAQRNKSKPVSNVRSHTYS